MMQLIVSTLFLLSLFTLSHSLSNGSLRTEAIHIDAGSDYTKLEMLHRMLERSSRRVRHLAEINSTSSNVTIPSFSSNGEYLVNVSIGTPAQPYVLTLDTSSNLIWTQCEPVGQYFTQPYPIFNPKKSHSFNYTSCKSQWCDPYEIPRVWCSDKNYCQYNYTYGDGSYTSGLLGTETFTLDSIKVGKIYFGCGNNNSGNYYSNECGIAGLARGNLSLVSQLGYSSFSHCFTTLGLNKSSPVFFGSEAGLTGYGNFKVQSTPFFPHPYSSFYYLILNGITVGTKFLDIPNATFAVNRTDGTGGTIIDSRSSITYFHDFAYEILKSEFISQVRLPVVLTAPLCFDMSSLNSSQQLLFKPPRFIFHFEGADLELPPQNYMMYYRQDKVLVTCLTMSNHSNPNPITILGNFQQQNIHMLYDLVGQKLSFLPAQCDQL